MLLMSRPYSQVIESSIRINEEHLVLSQQACKLGMIIKQGDKVENSLELN
jgi:hypothetical protein